MRAQREAIAVSSHGQITGYFIGPDEYEEFKCFRESRRSFATAELSEERVEAIGSSRMDRRHAHLDRMLDPKYWRRMPIPNQEPGLVISYANLQHHEHQAGREEGRKDGPSVIILAVER